MSKLNPIKDDAVLREARKLVKKEERWNGQKHARLIWALFRTELGFALPPEKVKEVAAKWDALYNNGRLGYSSNCDKGLVDAGICAASLPETAADLGDYK